MVEINQIFCGLQYLVGLDGQAEACLKIWESIIHKEKKWVQLPMEATQMTSQMRHDLHKNCL